MILLSLLKLWLSRALSFLSGARRWWWAGTARSSSAPPAGRRRPTVQSSQSTPSILQSTVENTRHPTPHTPHPTPTPYTLHPTPHTPHPTPSVLSWPAEPGPRVPICPSLSKPIITRPDQGYNQSPLSALHHRGTGQLAPHCRLGYCTGTLVEWASDDADNRLNRRDETLLTFGPAFTEGNRRKTLFLISVVAGTFPWPGPAPAPLVHLTGQG